MIKYKKYIPYIAALAVCAFVLFPVGSNNIVLDEAYSISLVRGDVGSIIRGAAGDVHPPLYYLILKMSSFLFGESLALYRVVTALATCLNVLILGATLIRKQWGVRTSVIYILWFGLTYGTLERSIYIRMYTWAAFFVTATAIFLFSYYQKQCKSSMVMGILMTLCAMYTHYYALIAVFLMWLFLLVFSFFRKKNVSWILLGGVLVTVGYLPWLHNLLSQSKRVADDYWMTGFDWNEWLKVPAALMETSETVPNGVGMILYTLMVITLILALIRKRWDALLCVAVFFGTMLGGAVLSVLVTPIWATRYMYVAWGLIALFMAITTGEVISEYSKYVQGTLVLILLIVGVYSLNTMLEDETMTSSADEWVAFLHENVESNAAVIYDDPGEHGLVYKCYLPDAQFICTETLKDQGAEERLEEWLTENEANQLWYVVDYTQQRMGPGAIGEYLTHLGYAMESEGSFTIKQKNLEVFRVTQIK